MLSKSLSFHRRKFCLTPNPEARTGINAGLEAGSTQRLVVELKPILHAFVVASVYLKTALAAANSFLGPRVRVKKAVACVSVEYNV